MAARDQEWLNRSDRLYEQYGKPLEGEHWGEYVAIFLDGRIIAGKDLVEVADRALTELGPGSFLFKVGEKAVGKMR